MMPIFEALVPDCMVETGNREFKVLCWILGKFQTNRMYLNWFNTLNTACKMILNNEWMLEFNVPSKPLGKIVGLMSIAVMTLI